MNFKIFVPGHSVVRLRNGSFKPSGIYQDIMYTDPPKSFPFRRTGVLNPHIDPDSATSYLGGGEIVVRGAAALYQQLAAPQAVVTLFMVGGRSDYLASVASEQPDLSEATVMRDMAYDLLGGKASVRTVEHTRTTEDDVKAIVEIVDREQCDRAYVMMMTFRLPRAAAILQNLIINEPGLEAAASRIVFASAEAYVPDPASYHRMWSSEAYKRTAANEGAGIRKMLLGQSATTGGKT